jgi:hypothetical protein
MLSIADRRGAIDMVFDDYGIFADIFTTVDDPAGLTRIDPMPEPLDDPPVPDWVLNCATIGERDWAWVALDELVFGDVGIVRMDRGVPIFVPPSIGRSGERRTIWPALRKFLCEEGVTVPRVNWRQQQEMHRGDR